MSRQTVLIADDDRSICTVLSQAVRRSGFLAVTTDDANELLQWVQEGKGDLIITDVLMPKGNGLEFLPRLKSARPELPVIVISANNTLMTAVKANELGAFEYFPKPFDLDALMGCVERTLAPVPAEILNAPPPAITDGHGMEKALVGRSAAMQEVYKTLAKLIAVDLTVMLNGESGTGKELIARTLHNLGSRKDKPFVAINMAAMPRELVESELFGHEKGAFTGAVARKAGKFEQAEGGTLFLDEIGDMPPEAQTKLLRTLQEKEYVPVGGSQPRKTDVRIVSATHRDLLELVKRGDFREDLFFRLNVVPIIVPPLRQRQEDIESLAMHCLAKAQRQGLPEKHLSADAITALQAHSWPGNVRELENLLFRLAALHSDAVIDGKAVKTSLQVAKSAEKAHSGGKASLHSIVEAHLRNYFSAYKGDLPTSGLYDRVLEAIEKPLLTITMEAVNGNQLKAADVLGINRNTLRKKLRDHGVEPFDTKERK